MRIGTISSLLLNVRLPAWDTSLRLLFLFVGVWLCGPGLQASIVINQLALETMDATNQSAQLENKGRALSASPSGRELALLGTIAAAHGQPEKAVAYLQAATEVPTRRITWLFQLATFNFQSGKPEDAWAVLSQIEEVDQLVFARCLNASIYYVNLEEAGRWCPLIERLALSSAESACLLGQYYMLASQLAEAELSFERAVAMPDVSDDCLYRYGLYRARQQQYSEAIMLYKKAFSQRSLPLYLRAMGNIYGATHEPELALEMYQQSYVMGPNDRECAESLAGMGGVYYYDYEDYPMASKLFQKAIRCDAKVDVSVYWLLAQSERQLGHPDEALQAYQVMTGRLMGNTNLLEWRHEHAAYLLELGRTSEARGVYQDILKDVPNDPVARSGLQNESR